jgi:lambda family phage portal protein
MIATTAKTPLSGLRADYEIAKSNGRFRRPRKGVSGVGTTGDYHFRNEAEWLYAIEYANDLDRNDCFAGMCVDRLIDNVLHDSGLQPDPDTGDENADMLLKRLWSEWASNEDACDMAGEMTFSQLERVVLRGCLVAGDILPIGNQSGALEIMEAQRCRTPTNSKKNIIFGIEKNLNRRSERYYFSKDELDYKATLRKVSDTVPIDARDEDGLRQVFHVFDPKRVSQTRGVSVFARVADQLGMHDDIEFANLVRQQIASCFAIIRRRTQQGPLGNGGAYGDRSSDGTRTSENIAPGMEIRSEIGESVEGFSPNIPSPQYFEQAWKILKTISANLNLPLQAVLLDASESNFSGWRGAMDQARTGFRRIQNFLIDKFHSRVWKWKVSQWVIQYPELRTWASQQGVDITKTAWKRPAWPYINPLQDAQADITAVAGLLNSLRNLLGQRGLDFDELMPEIVNDNVTIYTLCRDAARILNQEAVDDSEKVTWRELLAMPVPQGLNIQLAASADPNQFGGTATPQRGAARNAA